MRRLRGGKQGREGNGKRENSNKGKEESQEVMGRKEDKKWKESEENLINTKTAKRERVRRRKRETKDWEKKRNYIKESDLNERKKQGSKMH